MEQVRQAYASVAELYIELFGSSQQVHADDLAFIGRHLAGRPGTVAQRRRSPAARRHRGNCSRRLS